MIIKNRPTMLMILDGFGLNDSSYGNAIAKAKTPFLHKIFNTYPHTRLDASGLAVGLPEGQMGNSEVGHLNIGGGRVVYQELTRITKAITDGDFFENQPLKEAMNNCLLKGSSLHLLGLLSDGGVHSHIEHLFGLLKMAKAYKIEKVLIHCLLDGRDVPPVCAEKYFLQLEAAIKEIGVGEISSIGGRYFAMDRDKRWDRVEKAYDTMTGFGSLKSYSWQEALNNAYERGETDEFVSPTSIIGTSFVQSEDSVVMFNFRPDRAREITRAFVDPEFRGFTRKAKLEDLTYITLTQYDATMPKVMVAFPPQTIKNTLGEYVGSLGLNQLRIAETEKYAHVTFFFNGGVEAPVQGEDRTLVPSPKVPTYDLQPEMSAPIVCDKVLEAIDSNKYDMIILNFANADMVGHTGVMDAVVAAIEALDSLVEKISEKILKKDGQLLLTADHGNADVMLDAEGNVVTAHSLNQVPLVHIAREPKELKSGGKLADIAPTMLHLMGLTVPEEMTGNSLV